MKSCFVARQSSRNNAQRVPAFRPQQRLNEIHFATTLYIPPTRPAELDHSFLELLR